MLFVSDNNYVRMGGLILKESGGKFPQRAHWVSYFLIQFNFVLYNRIGNRVGLLIFL